VSQLVQRPNEQLRREALAIWMAGLEAVRSDRLVRENVRAEGNRLTIGGEQLDLSGIRHILVVGAGKAGAGMAAGLETALGPALMEQKQLAGWVHVPDDCVRKLARIHLHGARPAGRNEPTQAGVDGSREMLRRVTSLGPDDLCVALISGGGSALLPDPIEGVTLDDKLAVTRLLSAAGATIDELNIVRKHLSRIKGGGLARACGARRLIALVISDILGDPLDLIASGPTVVAAQRADEALAVLDRFAAREAGVSPRVFQALERRGQQPSPPTRCRVTNLVIGNNRLAVEVAERHARTLGYTTLAESARASEGPAEAIGRRLADAAVAMQSSSGPDCLISGGEPTVKLVESGRRGLGGRNQQLVLAAAEQLARRRPEGMLVLSAGTDGEDGPTDAAGAWVDGEAIEQAARLGLDPADYLARNDAYHWFEPLGALVKTGPTDTNVCDVRVVLVNQSSAL
jgi:hydroxypyruvate reductase